MDNIFVYNIYIKYTLAMLKIISRFINNSIGGHSGSYAGYSSSPTSLILSSYN